MADEPKLIRIDFDRMVDRRPLSTASDGGIFAKRSRRASGAEARWLETVMGYHEDWRDVVSLPPFTSIELEVQVTPAGASPTTAARIGLPRIDAIGHHADGTVTLIEAKVETSVVDVMTGAGQLIYYSLIAADVMGLKVANLLLVLPECPPYLIQTLAHYSLPVRVLKAGADAFYGAVPNK